MTDIGLTERISESITNTIKKTEAFEKLGKIEFYISSFVIISSIMGLTCVYMNYSTCKEIYNTKKQIQGNENVIKYNIEINRKRNLSEHCKIKSEILILGKQLSEIIENQKKIISQLDELKLLKNTDDIKQTDIVSTSTSMSSFSQNNVPSLVIECKLDIDEDNKDQDYDELLNECYDTIPLNNIKKNIGLSWLFK